MTDGRAGSEQPARPSVYTVVTVTVARAENARSGLCHALSGRGDLKRVECPSAED
ncbi:hypothetical protein AB0M95_09440 [Sphaerisporangium sp. NPDC051017]|uniref:hypothetical protein n=1 Tax=Sphaerisporangium sp. NPDC051017 TaxID=3154636 RepID=UPI003427B973